MTMTKQDFANVLQTLKDALDEGRIDVTAYEFLVGDFATDFKRLYLNFDSAKWLQVAHDYNTVTVKDDGLSGPQRALAGWGVPLTKPQAARVYALDTAQIDHYFDLRKRGKSHMVAIASARQY